MDWSQVTALTIPEGSVKQIAIGDVVLWKKSLLPEDYTQLEYIESTGTQYIDTGFTYDNTTKAHLLFAKTGDNTGNTVSGRSNVIFGANSSYGEILINWGSTNYLRGNAKIPEFTVPLNTKTDVIVDYTKNACSLTVNGTLLGTRNSALINLKNVLLFASNSNGGNSDNTAATFMQEKMYEFELWNGEDLVLNFVPAMRNSDGEVGLYDTVTRQFFTNAGTGNFIAGGTV